MVDNTIAKQSTRIEYAKWIETNKMEVQIWKWIYDFVVEAFRERL